MFAMTRSHTSAWTEARVRYVMDKVFEDLLNHIYAGLLDAKRADKWRKDLTYLLNKQAISQFQIQYHRTDGRLQGLGYRVHDSGVVYTDDASGGVDYYALPKDTKLSLVVSYRDNFRDRDEVAKELASRGWSTGGTLLDDGPMDRGYFREGYGLQRSLLGGWND